MTPAPSLCGMTRGYSIGEPGHPARFLVSPGLIPENRIRTRTSPVAGSGSGRSPIWKTSAAAPSWSYQAAIIAHTLLTLRGRMDVPFQGTLTLLGVRTVTDSGT